MQAIWTIVAPSWFVLGPYSEDISDIQNTIPLERPGQSSQI